MAEDLSLVEIQRRLKAARALRGLRAVDLQRVMVEDHQLKAEPIALAERGAKALPGGYRRLIADELGLPHSWFTAPEEDLFAQRVGPPPSVEELMARIQEVRDAVSEMSNKLTRDMRDLETSTANETQP